MTNTSKKSLKYNVTLEMPGRTEKASGESILEALDNMGLSWQDIKLKGVVKVKYGAKRAEKLYYLPQLKKMFLAKEFRIVQAKYLHKLLK